MCNNFGHTPDGQEAALYTISCGSLTAAITNYGATLVRLLVPDAQGRVDDVVLGCDDVSGYCAGTSYLGATIGRSANRIQGAGFSLRGRRVSMTPNENGNNLHSGPNGYDRRIWNLVSHTANALCLSLESPDGDQGLPGNAKIRVTYTLEAPGTLRIAYDGLSDRDTVFNMTNHSYFNLAGHQHTEAAMDQLLTIPGRFFNPDDAENIPTGELRRVAGTPMDFRAPKPIGRDIGADYEPLKLQGGYDHNWEVFCNPCAVLHDPRSGRTMTVHTDCPGIQFYAGNFLDDQGKDGVHYGRRSGVALETQFYPDSVNHSEWPQPFVKAGEKYHTQTEYRFSW